MDFEHVMQEKIGEAKQITEEKDDQMVPLSSKKDYRDEGNSGRPSTTCNRGPRPLLL